MSDIDDDDHPSLHGSDSDLYQPDFDVGGYQDEDNDFFQLVSDPLQNDADSLHLDRDREPNAVTSDWPSLPSINLAVPSDSDSDSSHLLESVADVDEWESGEDWGHRGSDHSVVEWDDVEEGDDSDTMGDGVGADGYWSDEDDDNEPTLFVLGAGGAQPVWNTEMNSDDVTDAGDSSRLAESNLDPSLVPQHMYLGRLDEVSGCNILPADTHVELPIFRDHHTLLLPTHTLPLYVFHPVLVATVHHALTRTANTFGFIKARHDACVTNLVGTTAEIYELDRETGAVGVQRYMMKARGRQRFRVISTSTQDNGVLLARVAILPDTIPAGPFSSTRSAALCRALQALPTPACKNRLAEARLRRFDTAAAPWPSWLYDQYSCEKLVETVIRQFQLCLTGGDANRSKPPKQPEALSYWVASNLPVDDSVRVKLLEMDCVVRRLRCELHLLSQFDALCCSGCGAELARCSDVFSMSAAGPQSIYVNSTGYLHEMLTVRRATHIHCVTAPTTHFSWFDGFAWQAAQCVGCGKHAGWRFVADTGTSSTGSGDGTAVRGVASFWGLVRTTLRSRFAGDIVDGESRGLSDVSLRF